MHSQVLDACLYSIKSENEIPLSLCQQEKTINMGNRSAERMLVSYHGNGFIFCSKVFPVDSEFSSDMTRSSCEQLIQESVEVQDMDPSILKGILSGRYFVTNLWHPIRGPNQDWPLALCDQSTLDRESDLEVVDYVTPTKTREHVMMYARDCHRWWYLSNQKTTEALLFQQHNSEQIEPSGIPHAAFFNPHSQQKEPRESIEVFCLCYYV